MLSPIRASNNSQLLDIRPFKDELAAQRNHFKFDISGKDRCTSYAVEIIIRDVLYTYSFSVAEKRNAVPKLFWSELRLNMRALCLDPS